MKKNHYSMVSIFLRVWKCKTLLVMRLTLLICLFFAFQSIAIEALSQNQRLSINQKSIKIEEIIQLIENKTDYYFMYSAKSIEVGRIVDIEATNKLVPEILDDIFKGTSISYKIDGRLIALSKNGEESVIGQQLHSVSGKVVDSSGAPLPGVSVVVKGTTTGVITDSEGNFNLSKVSPNSTLVFSFVGMKTQVINIGVKTTLNVTLIEDAIGIEEVVAIGYGTMKKSDLTGSIASVKSENITDLPSNNITQALQGRVAGVQIQQNSGAPGANMQVRIRGTNSIQGSNEPLWIIDGFPGNQNMLNPSDIESLEVLKDASSTAIYGSRGANGVVIITTKRGKAGTTRVDYEGSYSIQTVRKKLDMMNANEYAQLYNIYWKNIKGTEYFTKDQINSFGKGTDWQDLIFRAAPVHDHALSVSGGNERTQFSVGASYFDQAGIIKNNDFRRIVLRANVNHDISKKFSISYNAILGRTDNNPTSESDVSRSALTATPTVGPYDDNGKYRFLNNVYPFSPDNLINPIAYFNEVSNNQVANEIMANLAFTYKPIDGLSICNIRSN